MKAIPTLATLSTASFLVMVVVDYLLGERAEFLNAWSVIERFLGRTPSAGESTVFQHFGAAGEFASVLAINMVIGGILTMLILGWLGKN